MKLPKNGIELELKEELTRKDVKCYKKFIFKGAKTTNDGGIDQASILGNIEDQQDELIFRFVKTYNGNDGITKDIIDSLVSSDYEVLLKECQDRFKANDQKKS